MNEKRNMIIGFDLGKKESQICYYDRASKDAVSAAVRTGSSQYTFPTALSYSVEKNIWHFGPEAGYFSEQQGEILVSDLLELCMTDEPVVLEGKSCMPWELLKIFFEKSLELLQITDPQSQIRALMITVPDIKKKLVENLKLAFKELGLLEKRCFLQDYDESFYYHTMYQKPELWSRKVGLFIFDGDKISFCSMEVSGKTKPALAEVAHGETIQLSESVEQRDGQFLDLIEKSFGTDVYSSIFIVGEGFSQEDMPRSVNLLCRSQRRVFYGSNLYGKGAAFAAREKVDDRELIGYLFVGRDLVRNNIGMEMSVNGAPAYYPLIPAGVNWYEAYKEFECILDGTEGLAFVVSNMEDGSKKKMFMNLPDLPQRPDKTTRLLVKLEYDSPQCCHITVEDLGFGELFPTSGKVWHETMEV